MKVSLVMAAAFLMMVISSAADACAAVLVKDGQPRASIVVASDAGPVEKHAAEEFSIYVRKVTGAVLRIGPGEIPGLLPVRIGVASSPMLKDAAGHASGIRHDGFGILARKDGVQIFANEVRGTLYAVYHLLRKYGEVYFLYPGESGESIRKSPDFIIDDGLEIKNPAFVIRQFNLSGGSGWTPETYDWLIRNGQVLYASRHPQFRVKNNREFILKRAPVFAEGGHEMGSLLVGTWDYRKGDKGFREATDKLMKEHPEYFGLLKGKRSPAGNFSDRSQCCQPCTSNPETLKRMAKFCLERIHMYGDTPNIRRFINDDHTNWCECENCRRLDHPQEKDASTNLRSTRWWHFINYMAREILDSGKCPHTQVATLAYQNYRMPPMGIKPDPRVLVGISPHQRCYLHSLTDEKCHVNRDKYRPLFEQWKQAGARCYTYEYHTIMPGKTQYIFNEEPWIRDLQYYHSLNMAGYGMVTTAPNAPYRHYDGRLIQYTYRNHWMSTWQRHFLTGFFAWNIDADFDRISEKINSLYYGRAWEPMKAYRKLLTDAVLDSQLHMGYGTPTSVLGKCYDRPGLPQQAEKLLSQAEKLAGKDPLLLKRIALDREYFRENWKYAYDLYQATRQKECNARRRTGKIVIDGKFDELDWKKSDFISDFKIMPDREEKQIKADPETFVRVLYDEDNVYFAIEALKAEHWKVDDGHTGNGIDALNGSHLEIFLTPPELLGKYYHLGFNIGGGFYQALTATGSSRDEGVKVNPEYRIRNLPDRWVLETKIPLKPLNIQIRDGVVWHVNVARCALDKGGRLQNSSWSAGVFHGSDVHRNVAFSAQGGILKNGDLEDLTMPFKRTFAKGSKARNWNYLSEKVPNFWTFNTNNYGEVEVRHDKPASGKNYMRISGRNAFIFQYRLNFPKDKKVRCRISAQVRGQGEIRLKLYRLGEGKYFFGSQNKQKFNSPDQWITLENEMEVPSPENLALALRISGNKVDIDDIRIYPLPVDEEAMPTAEKHQ